eukprot:30294-Pelagococcus_subviridis.AAC.58
MSSRSRYGNAAITTAAAGIINRCADIAPVSALTFAEDAACSAHRTASRTSSCESGCSGPFNITRSTSRPTARDAVTPLSFCSMTPHSSIRRASSTQAARASARPAADNRGSTSKEST